MNDNDLNLLIDVSNILEIEVVEIYSVVLRFEQINEIVSALSLFDDLSKYLLKEPF